MVVFDSGLPGGQSRMSTSNVKVIFASAQHSNADRILMERIRNQRDPGGWTVVSSDSAVLAAARNGRMKTLRSAEFAQILSGPPTPPDDDAADVQLSPEEVDEWLDIFGEEE